MAGTSEIVQSLHSVQKLERDRGLAKLQNKISGPDFNEDEFTVLQSSIEEAVESKDATWEAKQGSLMAAKLLLQSQFVKEPFLLKLREACITCLSHDEGRVRLAAGEALGELCKKSGATVYLAVQNNILNGVKFNLERLPLEEVLEKTEGAQQLVDKLTGDDVDQETAMKAEKIFHDTAGWKNLETWMRCLQAVVEGCCGEFLPFINQELIDLISRTLTHTNRFVRETGYYVCAALVNCGRDEAGKTEALPSEGNTILQFGQQFAQHLANGLADNWSQVRLAASVATRNFLLNLPDEESRHKYFGSLLPRLCLNRYYVAEGVKIYCQETWRLVTKDHGKALVEKYIDETVSFYIKQSDADNHAVREAACACIAELGSKIDKEKVRPHVSTLLEALLVCFQDGSWPVRDAACVACGNFVLCFPDESKPSLDKLLPLFFKNLQDNIYSVRQGAGLSLAKVARAYGGEVETKLLEKIKEGIDGMEKQTSTAEKFGSLEKGPATFGVAKTRQEIETELHSDQQMYSCGSLAPKMGRGRDGGCMDHKFTRPSEPWELCDGCINLLAELSSLSHLAQPVSNLLPSLAKVLDKKDYTQHVTLLETACLQLPVIGKGIGKRFFKPHLELFFESIFYSLTCNNALTRAAATDCLSKLATFLGPNILKGRVELYNPHFLDHVNPILRTQTF
ncbi:putative serine/threonine-protein phosphatase PP2A regulatory subunit [Holothuria leucospilota]|uniref:Serine/threonine-protein phosphatase PP2A regulatory subunit n=1 Tax=Holothuria leucospilota TaxID=206669 RepID=A0A9Q1CHZ5_HOLLE|nr:putative serine/threonine-protein phosphatase PP2A regulatory subunit [Holothuria leucospilota]